jgi:hemolysin III
MDGMSTDTGRHRPQSLGEEIANSVSHGVAALLALAAIPVLVIGALPHGAAQVVGVSIFGAAMVVLYVASTLYHALPRNRAKRLFQVFDHSAIFILIAGTYTPFTLGALRGPWGWTLLTLVWTLAIGGIVFKAVAGMRAPIVSTLLYITMGWIVLIAIQPLRTHVHPAGIAWLVAGGVAYTAGVACYAADRLPYAHFVWHLFVMAGSACHVVAAFGYAA